MFRDTKEVNWGSEANVAGRLSNIGQNGFMSEASNGRNASFDVSYDEDFAIGILEMEPINDLIAVENDAQYNSNPNEPSDTIITKVISDAHNNG